MLTGIISGVIAVIVGLVLWFTRKAGGDSVKAQQGVDNAKASERIAQAVADSPRTLDDLRDQLRDGSGKL